jgi:hypothetical protein
LSYRRAKEAAPLSGTASMTVCTNDVALCNLVEHVVPIAISDASRDREFLVAQVVELQHDGIGLAAIDARVVAEIGDEENEPLFELGSLPPRCSVDVALFVGSVVLLLVPGAAGPAVGIPLASFSAVPREFSSAFSFLQREHFPIGATYSVEQTFP